MVKIKTKKESSFSTLILKAFFKRLMFLGHGFFCIWILSKQEQENKFWYLLICLFLLVFEGVFNATVRRGKEYHWFCPSAFLYSIVLIVTISFFREKQIQCIINDKCLNALSEDDYITNIFSKWPLSKRIIVIEQTGLLVLIIGRWLLPSGSISREQFSQILLIYIGTASDIVEFNEIYNNKDDINNVNKVGNARVLLHGVMAVWAFAVLQFSFTIILPEEGLKEEEEEEPNELKEISYFRKIKTNQVTPISYMHYKSILRKDFSEKRVSQNKNNVEVQTSFCKKNSNNNKLYFTGVTFNKQIPCINLHESRNVGSCLSCTTLEIKTLVPNSNPLNSLPKRFDGPLPISKRFSSPHTNLSSKFFLQPSKNEYKTSHKTIGFTNRECVVNKVPSMRTFLEPVLLKKEVVSLGKKFYQEENSLGIGKNELRNCFTKYFELIGTLLALCMQDGTFFIFRVVLITRYEIVTEMMILLTIKNALVIIVQVYRMLNMYCTEPITEEINMEDSHRLRNAMHLDIVI